MVYMIIIHYARIPRKWGNYSPTPPLRGCYTLALPYFYNKSAPGVAGAAATLGAIL